MLYNYSVINMKNKGFTIIELLVTISLIAVISVAAGVGINEMFVRQRERNYLEFIYTIEKAACAFAEVNGYEENRTVTIGELINDGYLNKNIKNPNEKIYITEYSSKSVSIIFQDNERKCSFSLTN